MAQTKITPDVIRKVAKLARLQLTSQEEELYASQLEPVLEHIDSLNKVDTSGVEPTFQVIDSTNVFQPDNSAKTLPLDLALSTAPKKYDSFVASPATIDK
jgi:aspartyl-tRNA(Asn)/glutamyl-tRNA(Gln) amidotransferase subunit C